MMGGPGGHRRDFGYGDERMDSHGYSIVVARCVGLAVTVLVVEEEAVEWNWTTCRRIRLHASQR